MENAMYEPPDAPAPRPALRYVLMGLEGTPDVLERLLHEQPSDGAGWDFHPDPERFTLREVVAHLADWDPIFRERMERMRDENNPALPDRDEGKIALERDYAHSDPLDNLARFRRERAQTIAMLRGLPPNAWDRPGLREALGPMTIESLAVMILGHDGYHTRQIAQWVAAIS